MAGALTAPTLVGALVLFAAGMMKLRTPAAATRAAKTLGVPANGVAVRLLAITEVALGAACAVNPTRTLAAALGATYAAFAVLAAMLASRRTSCGCFGENDTPASIAQSVLSAALAAAAISAAIWGAHGIPYVLGRPALEAAAIAIGLGGAVYATVLAYTELPRAWSAWSLS